MANHKKREMVIEFQQKFANKMDEWGFSFNNIDLYQQAFSHSSFINDFNMNRLDHNERLEFLGDAVLELTVSRYLFDKHPHLPEGNLTKMRATIVCEPSLVIFANKIELNDEAKQQKITFEKLGVGDYLVKGSTGFAQEGWYIEMPKDANGNVLVAVVYEQLDNNDISVKTYDYMLNKKGRIVPDLETPLDIPETRWIDLRLQALPQTDIKPFNNYETAILDA